MQELSGNLWDCHANGEIVAITTGGLVGSSGNCAMPRGCAAEARKRFPGIDRILGSLVRLYGNHVHNLGNRIVSFPVENSPFENPEMQLIVRSCRELVKLADANGWDRIIVPRPGCGGGGLDWTEVRRVIEPVFDDRFYLIDKERT